MFAQRPEMSMLNSVVRLDGLNTADVVYVRMKFKIELES